MKKIGEKSFFGFQKLTKKLCICIACVSCEYGGKATNPSSKSFFLPQVGLCSGSLVNFAWPEAH